MSKIKIQEICLQELTPDLLANFNRFQVTRFAWVEVEMGFEIRENPFIDDWDVLKKTQVIEDLRSCNANGGGVVGAYKDSRLVGFCALDNTLLGINAEYLDLIYLHVSAEFRSQEIGSTLFAVCCDYARKLGAKKLYIAAHPSTESQAFYRSLGCRLAAERIQHIVAREPLDIQMEFIL